MRLRAKRIRDVLNMFGDVKLSCVCAVECFQCGVGSMVVWILLLLGREGTWLYTCDELSSVLTWCRERRTMSRGCEVDEYMPKKDLPSKSKEVKRDKEKANQ